MRRHHPCLFFRSGADPDHKGYEIGIEVEADWWAEVPDKPTDIECNEEADSGLLYLVLAVLPVEGISESHHELMHMASLGEKKTNLEACGWTLMEQHGLCELRHRYFTVTRHELIGESSVGDRIQWNEKSRPLAPTL